MEGRYCVSYDSSYNGAVTSMKPSNCVRAYWCHPEKCTVYHGIMPPLLWPQPTLMYYDDSSYNIAVTSMKARYCVYHGSSYNVTMTSTNGIVCITTVPVRGYWLWWRDACVSSDSSNNGAVAVCIMTISIKLLWTRWRLAIVRLMAVPIMLLWPLRTVLCVSRQFL